VPCLYVTHNVGEALAVAERLVLLRDGAVEAEGRPIDLLAVPGVAREAEGGLENLMSVRITAHDADAGVTRIDVAGGPSVTIPLAPERAIGSAATLAIRAEDILVSVEPVRGLSARNVVAARVTTIERAGADAILRCALAGAEAAPPWLVRITPAAVRALALVPGSDVWLAVKSHSVRLV
jgi:molybdate transport system ATP-binding protein